MITLAEKSDIETLENKLDEVITALRAQRVEINTLKTAISNLERNKADKVWNSTPLNPQPVWLSGPIGIAQDSKPIGPSNSIMGVWP